MDRKQELIKELRGMLEPGESVTVDGPEKLASLSTTDLTSIFDKVFIGPESFLTKGESLLHTAQAYHEREMNLMWQRAESAKLSGRLELACSQDKGDKMDAYSDTGGGVIITARENGGFSAVALSPTDRVKLARFLLEGSHD